MNCDSNLDLIAQEKYKEATLYKSACIPGFPIPPKRRKLCGCAVAPLREI